MTKIEQIEFENVKDFKAAINKILAGEEDFKSYKKDGETKQKKIIGKNRLYLNNNFSINMVEADNGKVYVSIDYFTVENRFDMAKQKSEEGF